MALLCLFFFVYSLYSCYVVESQKMLCIFSSFHFHNSHRWLFAQPKWATHEEVVPVAPHSRSHYHSCIFWRQLQYLCISLWLYMVIVSGPLVWKCPSLWCRNSPQQKCRHFISCSEACDTMERSRRVHRVSPAGVVASTSTVSLLSSLFVTSGCWRLRSSSHWSFSSSFLVWGKRNQQFLSKKVGRQSARRKKKSNVYL